MTATTTTLVTRRRAAMVTEIGRLARRARSFLVAIGGRWNDFVDSGQLGPGTGSVSDRHTGSWS